MTVESLSESNTTYNLLPEGLKTLAAYAAKIEFLPVEEQENMFDGIARALEVEQCLGDSDLNASDKGMIEFFDRVEADRHSIAWSYLPLVFSLARKTSKRYEGPTRLEDYVQSGVDGVYKAIDAYARLDKGERHSFPNYVKASITDAMRTQRLQDTLNTDPPRRLVASMYDYIKAKREAVEEGRSQIDIPALARARGSSLDTIYGAIGAAATIQRGSELPDTEKMEEILSKAYDYETEEPKIVDRNKLSYWIEKALVFLAPRQRYYVKLHFGLDEEQPTLTVRDMAELPDAENTQEKSIRKSIHAALDELKVILTHFEAHGTNFDLWPKEDVKRYLDKQLTVFTYLYRAGVAIPHDRDVQELRIIAMQDIMRRDVPDKHKAMVADMFGLHTGEKPSAKELVRKYHYSCSSRTTIMQKLLSAPYKE